MIISFKDDVEEIASELGTHGRRQIELASQRVLNKTVAKGRTMAARRLKTEVKARAGSGAAINKRVVTRKARSFRGVRNLTAHIDFSELGLGVENTGGAVIRKVRGSKTKVRVSFKGKSLRGAFRLPNAGKVTFVRQNGKIKRLFSHTLVQEAEHSKVFKETQEFAAEFFVKELLRVLKVFR